MAIKTDLGANKTNNNFSCHHRDDGKLRTKAQKGQDPGKGQGWDLNWNLLIPKFSPLHPLANPECPACKWQENNHVVGIHSADRTWGTWQS